MASFRSTRKSKRVKNPPETHNASDVSDITPKRKNRKPPEGDGQSFAQPLIAKNHMKPPQLEKRNQDGNEWKASKKADYQRLETVLEEGQLSSEETASKPNCEELGKISSEISTGQVPMNVGRSKAKKAGVYNVSVMNNNLFEANGIGLQSQKQHWAQQQLMKIQKIQEKNEKAIIQESYGEPTESVSEELDDKFVQNQCNVIINGMMEILPIFSNDKFVCSRDAISLEEYEDLEMLEKKVSVSGRSAKDTSSMEMKSLFSTQTVRRDSFSDQLTDKLIDSKDLTEREFQYKALTDKNINFQDSSPFINSLMILSPFAKEKKFPEHDISFNGGDSAMIEELDDSLSRTPGQGVLVIGSKVVSRSVSETSCGELKNSEESSVFYTDLLYYSQKSTCIKTNESPDITEEGRYSLLSEGALKIELLPLREAD